MSPTSRFDPHVSRFPGMALMKLATLLALGVAFWYLASHLLRDEQAVTWAPAEAPCDLRQGPAWPNWAMECGYTSASRRRLALPPWNR
ncbi:hypothetical protein [Halomonas sp. E19]|uniref:hypothetical protein n=1 Tax=Halomonas sp. E19 TaxID=3397247 RepID=UPI0040342697